MKRPARTRSRSSAPRSTMAAPRPSFAPDSITRQHSTSAASPLSFVTGGVGAHDSLNEANVGRDYLTRLGLPDDAVIPLAGGHDTYSSIEQVQRWFAGRESRRVLLVSDGFHMLRLRIIARRLGLTPYTSPAAGSPIHANVRRNTGYLFAEGFKVPFTWMFQH